MWVEWIKDGEGVVFWDIKLNLVLLENLGNDLGIVFENMIVDGMVVEDGKVCGI